MITVAQIPFLENSFEKHNILTSLEAILERFVFKILKFRALIMVFFHVLQYGFYISLFVYLSCATSTGVWQDCEFCGKFTFTFRKKFYL